MDEFSQRIRAERFGTRTFKWVGGESKAIDDLVKHYGDMAASIVVRAVTDMGDDIISNTPVDTGRLVLHWKLGLNSAPGAYRPKLRGGENSDTIDPSPIATFKIGDRIYIYNKAPYAAVIEELGSKTTAPGQMLHQQRLGWSAYVQRAAQDLTPA